ncbi:MAG: LamG domain-containing protein [Planctomycetota bacterium]
MPRYLIILTALLALSGCCFNFSKPTSEPYLMGWWQFLDNPGSVAKDNSGNGNDAIINGATWKDGTLYFDGVDDCVITPIVDTLQNFTMEAWVNAYTDSPHVMDLISKRSFNALSYDDFPFALVIDKTGLRADVAIDGGNDYSWDMSAATTEFEPGWRHIAATYDSSTLNIYVDGQLSGSKKGSLNLSRNSLPYTIGRAACEAPGQVNQIRFKGSIGEVWIYSGALSPEQIYQNYNYSVSIYRADE